MFRAWQTHSGTWFAILRDVDSDDAVRDRFRADPLAHLQRVGADHGLDPADAVAPAALFDGLEGEAWLATFHALLDWLEGTSQAVPAQPNVRFGLSSGGHVESVVNRGGNSRLAANPFYDHGRPETSASDVAAEAGAAGRSQPRVTIFDEFAASEVSRALAARHVALFHQRSMLKAHVIRAADAGGIVPPLSYDDLSIELEVDPERQDGLHLRGVALAASAGTTPTTTGEGA